MQTDVVIKHLHADHETSADHGGSAAVVRLCAHVHALSDGRLITALNSLIKRYLAS